MRADLLKTAIESREFTHSDETDRASCAYRGRGEVPTVNPETADKDQITLANGYHLRIRSLRRGEDGVVRELFARLSLPTRYLRFFLPLPVLSDSLLRMLADVDDTRRIALVAELGAADGGDIVALGNVGPTDGGRAELGLVVADAWQRQGIGTALADRLLQAGEACGYRRFVVHSLAVNPALRPLLAHVADVVSTRTRYGVSEIALVRRRPVAVSSRASRFFVEATTEGEAAYNASREPGMPDSDPLEQAYERILARPTWRS
jgi:GNAT superfamily N-acetyltransferase